MRWLKYHKLFILAIISCSSYFVKAQTSQYKDASSELEIPTEEQLIKDDPDPVVMSAQIAVRLKKIQQTIPLDYNEHVQKFITYNTKRKEHIAKMLGRSKKFFPIFESIFAQNGVPEEMKYLAVVESALNPFAVSPKGASGLWQFMYSTGLRYDLGISKRVDERRDPYKGCEAAAHYLKEMYNLYGNWQLAIASYNCGAGNVNKAIRKAGGSHNFWDIRQYLPAETRAYVPSFIAIVYSMKYANKYGIAPLNIERENTQRVTVRQKITVGDLENIIGIPRQVIIDENPSLLTTLIPADFTLNIPVSRFTAFNEYQDSLYVKAENVTVAQKLVVPKVVRPVSSPKELPVTENCDEPVALVVSKTTGKDDFSTEPIVKGKDNKTATKTDNKEAADDESFFTKLKNKILPTSKPKEAEKPVAVKEAPKPKEKETKPVALKTDPKTDKNKTAPKDVPVATVVVKKPAKDAVKQETKTVKAPENPAVKPLNTNTSTNKKIITPEIYKEDDDNYRVVVYTVKNGDNLGFIANWFHVKVKEVRRWNELNGNFIDVDDELLIYVHNNDYKKFVRFNYISNRLKDLLSEKIQTQEEKDAIAMKEAQKDSASIIDKINPIKILSKNKNCFETYKIKGGENLWSIAQKYDDVTVQDLMQWNGFSKTPVLHKGDEIKVRKIECK
ncbi:MAG: transglycosylase SLT domain-containing protein [Chitinophagales bacterium]